ncbi:MAG TPA: MCE family protein [Pseudonocardia sp.]|uniref:MCE family protein n=1 Tax=Pseudonocardia sp. TaxID=60912 RepID=UPI002ED96E68
MSGFGSGRGRTTLIALVCVFVLVLVTGLWWLSRPAGATRLTAYFDRAVGLYEGSAVRVLGVRVGTVDRVVPDGPAVRVDLTVDHEYPIPAGASAAIIASSLVSDRYVQLTPAYIDGPRMASGAVIPRERTATPVEIDELLRSVDTLSTALGPDGANKTGALSEVLDTTAANLDGNGAELNTTLVQLGKLADTLGRSRGDLFATVDNLNKFTATLARSDAQVRQFQSRLADVSGYLGSERGQVGDTLDALAGSLGQVSSFVKDNRELVASNLRQLTDITQALVDERKALAEVIDVAPLGSSNYVGAYDAASASVGVRAVFNEFELPLGVLVCTILQRYSEQSPQLSPPALTDALGGCVSLMQQLHKVLPLPTVAQTLGDLQQGKLPLQLPGSGG